MRIRPEILERYSDIKIGQKKAIVPKKDADKVKYGFEVNLSKVVASLVVIFAMFILPSFLYTTHRNNQTSFQSTIDLSEGRIAGAQIIASPSNSLSFSAVGLSGLINIPDNLIAILSGLLLIIMPILYVTGSSKKD